MSPRKKTAAKANSRGKGSSQRTVEAEIVETIYDHTSGLLQKDGETLKWGEVYYMFKKSNFSIESEELDELQAFRNIKKSGIFRLAAHPAVFSCADAISWILKNIHINSQYVCNARKEPMASFKPNDLARCYHIEVGIKTLDGQLLSELELTPKDLFPGWYKADKQLKYRPRSRYPTINLRIPYQYMVVMLCRLYGDPYATHFPLSYMPLIYFYADVGVPFNWENMLSENLKASISVVTQAQPGTFPSFHVSSYLLDIMCTLHRYLNMGLSLLPTDASIHIYCKVL